MPIARVVVARLRCLPSAVVVVVARTPPQALRHPLPVAVARLPTAVEVEEVVVVAPMVAEPRPGAERSGLRAGVAGVVPLVAPPGHRQVPVVVASVARVEVGWEPSPRYHREWSGTVAPD